MNKEKIKEFFNKDIKEYLNWNESKHSKVNLNIIHSLRPNSAVLSLGCGAGREVKELVKMRCKVTAIDFSKKMVEQSKKIAPNAEYYCEDAISFARRNKNNLKFDYIIGLYSLLNYIPKKERRELINNLYAMLNNGGIMIFEIRRVDERIKDILKCVYFYCLNKAEEFGDISTDTPGHHFTIWQLKKLFYGYNYEIIKSVIKIRKLRKILIIKNDHIGDLVMATPVFREIKENLPESEISVLVSRKNKELIQKNKYIKKIFEIDPPQRNFSSIIKYYKLSRYLKKRGFDTGIDLRGSLMNSILLFISGIKERIGLSYYHRLNSLFLTRTVKINSLKTTRHINKENLDIINSALNIQACNFWPDIQVDEEDKQCFKSFINKNKIKKYICINPTASMEYKQWGEENYDSIIKWINKKYKQEYKIVLIGGKNEETLKRLGKNKNCIVLSGENLRVLYSIYQRSNLVLTNDGGPMHIAWASKARVIALFSKYPANLENKIKKGEMILDYYKKVYPLGNSTIIQSESKDINCIKIEKVKNVIEKNI